MDDDKRPVAQRLMVAQDNPVTVELSGKATGTVRLAFLADMPGVWTPECDAVSDEEE